MAGYRQPGDPAWGLGLRVGGPRRPGCLHRFGRSERGSVAPAWARARPSAS